MSEAIEYLKHDDEAVINHMSMYQEIISRMAGNSAAIKSWGIPFITAVMAFAVTEKAYSLLWVLMGVVAMLYLLDSYYLMLEKRYRYGFINDADLVSTKKFSMGNLFKLTPSGSAGDCFKASMMSISTWPVYLTMLVGLLISYFLLAESVT